MLVVDYTQSLTPTTGLTVRYKKERSWTGSVVTRCNAVKATRPDIIEAYAAHGIPTYEELTNGETQEETRQEERQEEQEVETEQEIQELLQASPEIPDGWRELPWPQLRSLACSLTDEPVKSKEQAIEVIESNE